MLLDAVQQIAGRVLGMPASRRLDPEEGLADAGMDSLMAVELRDRLAAAVGRPLSATLAFDRPNAGRDLTKDRGRDLFF